MLTREMKIIVLPLWEFSIIPSIIYVICNFKDQKEMEIKGDSIWSLLLLPVLIAPVFMVKYYKLKMMRMIILVILIKLIKK